MIPIHQYEGRRVAVFGLGRTGIATAKALAAGGADVSCWDDSEAARDRALAAGLQRVPAVRASADTARALARLGPPPVPAPSTGVALRR